MENNQEFQQSVIPIPAKPNVNPQTELSRVFEHYAPPGVWGTWKTIASHVNGRGYKIKYEPIIDGPSVAGEVKYYSSRGEESKTFYKEIDIMTYGLGNVDVRFNSFPTGVTVRGSISP